MLHQVIDQTKLTKHQLSFSKVNIHIQTRPSIVPKHTKNNQTSQKNTKNNV
ncbi:hypothetical protein HanRHA438_Chr13g0595081 [Helianthus annuus]|nr:hypothetical protein HanRHA438_Chr13g0595081 [Helianthus annuus]